MARSILTSMYGQVGVRHHWLAICLCVDVSGNCHCGLLRGRRLEHVRSGNVHLFRGASISTAFATTGHAANINDRHVTRPSTIGTADHAVAATAAAVRTAAARAAATHASAAIAVAAGAASATGLADITCRATPAAAASVSPAVATIRPDVRVLCIPLFD